MTAHAFPDITPSQRTYTPGVFPQSEFEGLNGAVTTVAFGFKSVDSKLQMTFTNITDDQAWEIFDNYQKVNSGVNPDTGERDYVLLSPSADPAALRGIQNANLRNLMAEQNPAKLRYRYGQPTANH